MINEIYLKLRKFISNNIKLFFIYPLTRFYYRNRYYRNFSNCRNKKGKVYDCFIFSNEIELLELRLNELNNVVDYFVIVEGLHDFRGLKRELIFENTKHKFEKYLPKIRYIIVKDLESKSNPWEREFHLRNSISNGLIDVNNNDFIWISDVDEIPNPEKVWNFGAFDQFFSYYFLNALKKYKLPCTVGVSGEQFLNNPYPQKLRENRFMYGIVRNGGWHFSYLYNRNNIIKKIETFAHDEFDKEEYKNIEILEKRIKNLEDLFERKGEELYKEANLNFLPKNVLLNLDYWSKWII